MFGRISFEDFIEATYIGNTATINNYISQHRESGDLAAAVNAADQDGDTALSLASANGYTATVQALLDAGANVNAADPSGYTALIWAAYHGRINIVTALLAAGANVNAANPSGNTALIWAAANGHFNTVQALLATDINLTAQNYDHRTAAAEAEARGFMEIYRLINEAIRLRAAQTPGVAAAAAAPAIAAGVSLANCQQAARIGDLTTVQGYIRANRDNRAAINAADTHGDTILIIAAMHGQVEIVNELIRVPEIDITTTNTDHRTAAAEAQYNNHIDIATQLTTLIALHEHDQMPVTETLAAESLSTGSPVSPKAAPSFEERLAAIPDFDESQIPEEFIDPISHGIINDPIVVSKSGITYDRASLTSYFASKGNPVEIHCPTTTKFHIGKDELNFNTSITIKNMIEKFVCKQASKYKQRQEHEKAAATAAASNPSVASGNSSKDAEMPDAEKKRAAKLKVFGGTLPASNQNQSPTPQAAQLERQDDAMAIDRSSQHTP